MADYKPTARVGAGCHQAPALPFTEVGMQAYGTVTILDCAAGMAN